MFKTITSSLDPKKHPQPEEIQKIPPFIFARWLSGNQYTIQAANIFNMYPDIPIENQYQMVKSAFAGKIRFIPYPKSASEETQKKVQYLAEHFKISESKASEYLEFISSEELQRIVDMYTERDLKK
jgi:hypothetical protein